MSDEILVKVQGVSKKFCKSLKHSIRYGIRDIVGDVFDNGRAPNDTLRMHEFWAVDDVSFEIRRGECLGLIGRNGAGKSTLLKMLGGIILPDKGIIEVHGRVAALIELGAGFHPMLTGRENIYVNAAVLGMSKEETRLKFDEIVTFAELEDFIDTPVKFYSSGMYVRLGFAVAAHLSPTVLLIDEVLAVGDIGFRAKCYNLISEIMKDKAVIFVTHSMPMLSRIAQKAMVLNKGRMQYAGPVNKAILTYHEQFQTNDSYVRTGSGEVVVQSLSINKQSDIPRISVSYGQSLEVDVRIRAHKKIEDLIINIAFRDMFDNLIAECNNYLNPYLVQLEKSETKQIQITINEITLNPGLYKMALLLMSSDMLQHYDWIRTAKTVEVIGRKVGSASQQIRASWKLI